MKKELEIAVLNGNNSSQASKNLYQRHNREGIPYIEVRKGKNLRRDMVRNPSQYTV